MTDMGAVIKDNGCFIGVGEKEALSGMIAPPFSPLKYRIEEMLIQRYGKERKEIKKFLAKVMQISVTTVQNELSIAFGSNKRIPPKRLKVYAKFFDCTIEELRNHKFSW